MKKKSLLELPGSHRNRVFVGGSSVQDNLRLLNELKHAVCGARFVPIVASDYKLLHPERDVHDVTLWLLHGCRLAVFEVSTHSGALMELERLGDYGIRRALLLYQHPGGLSWPKNPSAWQTTQMLQSLALEQEHRLTVHAYARPAEACRHTQRFLQAVRRSVYGRLHGL